MQPSLKPLTDPAAPIVLDKIVFGGIGKRNIEPPPGGTLVQIPTSFLAPGDFVALHWKDPTTPVAEFVYTESQVAAFAQEPRDDLLPTVTVAAGHLALYTGDVDVWYVVRNSVSGSVSESEHTMVRVNFLVPGDPDPDHTTEHINENLVPVVTDDIVDLTKDVVLSIPRWLNCEPADRLVVSWGKNTLDAVTIPDCPAAVTVTVPASVIAANPGDIVVTYFVIDEVSNHSLSAPPTIVHVGPKDEYPAPVVQDTDDNGNLPIEELALGPVSVEVAYPTHAAGDVVVLTWGGVTREGVPIAETTYTFTWADTIKHTFKVPYDRVLPLVGGEIRTSYTVEHAGDPAARRSGLAIVRVIGTAVSLPPPRVKEAVGDALDPAVLGVGATVQVATDYAFVSEGDRVVMRWRGVSADGSTVVTDQQTKFVDGTIGSTDAATTTSAQGRRATNAVNPLEFVVPKAKIEIVAGGAATVSYDVLTPSGVVVASGPLTLSIKDTSADALPPPSVDGATLDDTLDPADVGASIIVRVPANAALQPPATVIVTWLGTDTGGSFTTPAQNASPTGMRFDVDKTVLAPNIGKAVAVSYTLRQAGMPDRTSKIRTITILDHGEIGDLPAPTVREAVGAQLDPVTTPAGCTVVIPPLADIEATDQVAVIFGSYTTPSQSGAAAGTFAIPISAILAQLGSPVQVTYVVKRAGASRVSDPLVLTILDIPSNDPRFLPPAIAEALGTFELDLKTFTGDATVTVKTWPLMAPGQRFWLTAIAGGVHQPVVDGETVSNVADLNKPLSRAWLETLDDGTTIVVELKIAFAGGSESMATTIASLPYTLLSSAGAGWKGRAHELETFEEHDLSQGASRLVNGSRFRFFEVTAIDGHARLFGEPRQSCLQIGSNSGSNRLRMRFNGLINELRFTCRQSSGSGKSRTYDKDGQVLEEKATVPEMMFTAIAGRAIAEWELENTTTDALVGTFHYIDNVLVSTGIPWTVRLPPHQETFASLPIGNYGSMCQTPDWTLTTDIGDIAVGPPLPDTTGHVVVIPLTDRLTPTHRFSPRFAMRPTRAASIRLRCQALGHMTVRVCLEWMDLHDGTILPTIRTAIKTITLSEVPQTIEFEVSDAYPSEFVSHLWVTGTSANAGSLVIYDELKII